MIVTGDGRDIRDKVNQDGGTVGVQVKIQKGAAFDQFGENLLDEEFIFMSPLSHGL